jgi:hypothetical protein
VCVCVKQHSVPFEICIPEYTYSGKVVPVNALMHIGKLQSLLILALDGLSNVIHDPMALFIRK